MEQDSSYAQAHFDYDNTLTNEKRDFKATFKNIPTIWKNAKEHGLRSTEGLKKSELLKRTISTFIYDIGLYKPIRPEAKEILEQIKTFIPEIKINSARVERQLSPTQAYMEKKGLLGTADARLIDDIHFRPPTVSEEESKTQYLQQSLKKLNEEGKPDGKIVVIDDNIRHALALSQVKSFEEEAESRVDVYWLNYGDKEQVLRQHHVTELPTNIHPVKNLYDVRDDLTTQIRGEHKQ